MPRHPASPTASTFSSLTRLEHLQKQACSLNPSTRLKNSHLILLEREEGGIAKNCGGGSFVGGGGCGCATPTGSLNPDGSIVSS